MYLIQERQSSDWKTIKVVRTQDIRVAIADFQRIAHDPLNILFDGLEQRLLHCHMVYDVVDETARP